MLGGSFLGQVYLGQLISGAAIRFWKFVQTTLTFGKGSEETRIFDKDL